MSDQVKIACPLEQAKSIQITTKAGGYEKNQMVNIATTNTWGFTFAKTSDQTSSSDYAPTTLLVIGASKCLGIKSTGGGSDINVGQRVYWNTTSNLITTNASGAIYLGICSKSASASDSEVEFIFDRTGDL